MIDYIVVTVVNHIKTEKNFRDHFQDAAEYYFKNRPPFLFGKNGGSITLCSVETKEIMSCY